VKFELQARDFVRPETKEGKQVRKVVTREFTEREYLANVRADLMDHHVITKVMRNEICRSRTEESRTLSRYHIDVEIFRCEEGAETLDHLNVLVSGGILCFEPTRSCRLR
jgi:hypothetical protein